MSPEQARGLLDLDQRTDIYSMGVILYEALSGQLPYDSPYIGDLILAIVMGGAPRLHELRPDLDPRLCDVVMKAMASDPLARFQTVRELLAALSSVAPLGDSSLRSDRPPSSVALKRGEMSRAQPARLETGEADLAQGSGAAPASLVEAESQLRLPTRSLLKPSAIVAGVVVLLLAGVWLGMQRSSDAAMPIAKPLQAPPETPPVASGGVDPNARKQPTQEVPATDATIAPEAAPGSAPAREAAPSPVVASPVEPEPAPTHPREVAPKPVVERARPAPKPRVQRSDRERPQRVITELDY
jgi:serine/threonine-protein kinase